MDKTILISILVAVTVLAGIIGAGFAGLETQLGTDMHSKSVIDEHGAVYTTTWRD